jgi:hypothetical protein
MNRIQLQPGLSLLAFLEQFGTETQCEAALERARWPDGFRCPHCGEASHSVLRRRGRKTVQCQNCRVQTSLIVGTVFQSTHLGLTSDGLACFTGVTAAGCYHQAILIGLRKPNKVLKLGWLNTILGNLKTRFSGAYHAFHFAQYGSRDLAAFVYRFNRRFHLDTLPARLLVAAAAIRPRLPVGFGRLKNLVNQDSTWYF